MMTLIAFSNVRLKQMAKLRALPDEVADLLLTNSISPIPLHKTLVLLEALAENHDDRFSNHERLALATALVNEISNLHFGPEVGVGPAKSDAPVVSLWLDGVRAMAQDLENLPKTKTAKAVVYQADARDGAPMLPVNSVDAVITSPPYPNEKDYTRTTRLEAVLLGFIQSKQNLRDLKKQMVRSNTRSVYKADTDDLLVAGHPQIESIAAAIEKRRIELNKDSGFERLYARVTKLYFGGMTRHLAELRRVLRPGAQLAYVVGDQASYLRVMIRTGQLLAGIAESLGYEVVGLDLFRTRLATATKEQLREEVVVLRWPGNQARQKVRDMKRKNRYSAIIEKIFTSKFKPGMKMVDFAREEFETVARQLRIKLPKNLGDLVYSFRYRADLPAKNSSGGGQGRNCGSSAPLGRHAIGWHWLLTVQSSRT